MFHSVYKPNGDILQSKTFNLRPGNAAIKSYQCIPNM